MNRLTGKKAMVLGGSRGIGAAIVRRLAAEGASLTFTYVQAEAPAAALAAETGARALQVDSADRAALVRAVGDAGTLDILVANAATAVFGDPLAVDPDAVDAMIDLNVRAVWHGFVEAARHMAQGGRLIAIGSANADRVPTLGGGAYALTKAALQGMVRGLARDFGGRGITVNVVQPGPVDTDANPADGPFAAKLHGFMAIPRHVRADEVAALVTWLASAEAAMVTGTTQTIDGGFSA